jgi:transposase-like protein
MGLSRRQFPGRVQVGRSEAAGGWGSWGEVARALEVNPNVLQRWRREFRQGPGNVYADLGKRRWRSTS